MNEVIMALTYVNSQVNKVMTILNIEKNSYVKY